MCGRVIQRAVAAPSQDLLVIRRNHATGAVSLDPLRWGFIPHWSMDPTGGRKPINARCVLVGTMQSPIGRRGSSRGPHCSSIPAAGTWRIAGLPGPQ